MPAPTLGGGRALPVSLPRHALRRYGVEQRRRWRATPTHPEPQMPADRTPTFRPGDRVRVSPEHPWAPNAAATVADAWPTWPRAVRGEDGTVTTFVLVAFDTPQIDGDDRYETAELDTRLLSAG
jgi:hypothetical protein